jgi:mannitol/fructose-specific phosphotransferase system IIA component (Ntr-type)
MAGRISTLLDPARIVLHLQSTNRGGALQEVAHLLAGHPEMTDFGGFYEDLLIRDRLDSTCLGNGLALPHARTSHVRDIMLAVGRSDAGILFEHGQELVNLFFMLGTPESQPGEYLVVLRALCKICKAPADRAALLAAPTPATFIAAVAATETRLGL